MRKNYSIFPRTLLLTAALAVAATASAQTSSLSELNISFTRSGSTASDVTVSLTDADGADIEGASASIAITTDDEASTLKTSGTAVTDGILCPDTNGNTGAVFVFTLTLSDLPEGFSFNTVDASLWALNASGATQTVGTDRTWNIALSQGANTDNLSGFDSGSYNLAETIPYTAQFDGTTITATDGSLVLQMTASFPASTGCYIGLETLRLYTIPETEVTYNYTYGDEVKATETLTARVGAAFPEPTELPDYIEYTLPSGTVTADGGTYDVACEVNFPFEVSAAPTDGNFAEDSHWYVLNIRSTKYVSKSADGSTYSTTTYNVTPGLDENVYWCFTMGTGFCVNLYNLAAGASAPVYVQSNEIYFGETAQDFEVLKYDDNGTFVLRVNGTDNECINELLNNEATSHMGTWNDATATIDAGSQLVVTSAADVINDICAGAVGSYPSTVADAFNANPTTTTLRSLCNGDYETITLVPGGWYRIQNYLRKASTGNTDDPGNGGYMEVVDLLENSDWTGAAMVANDADDSRATAIWQFVSTGTEGQYYLYNQNADVYSGYHSSQSQFFPTSETTDNAGQFTVTSYDSGQSLIVCTQSGYQLHASGNVGTAFPAGIMSYNAGTNSASAWYIIPATTINLTVSSAGWATMNYPFAVELPEGLTAYTVTGKSDDNTTVYLTEVEGTTIPANTPVLLEGEAATYTLTLLPDNDEDPLSGNLLSGTTMYENLDENVKAYVLAQVDDEVGFYIVESGDDADRTVKANKAYYVPDATAANALRFSFGDAGMATGISTATTPTTDGAKVYYDLNGRRVLYPSRGIYVTADGQKVFIK